MKSKWSLRKGIYFIGLGLICTLLIVGCKKESSSSAPPVAISSESGNAEKMERELQCLRDKVSSSENENKALQKENSVLRKKIDQNKWRIWTLTLSVVLLIGFPCAAFLGMLFSKSDNKSVNSLLSECPKCSWELDVDTDVCPNPHCQTRLR